MKNLNESKKNINQLKLFVETFVSAISDKSKPTIWEKAMLISGWKILSDIKTKILILLIMFIYILLCQHLPQVNP